ncbi:ankyrin repeat domain-containing protein [Salmonella enterica subsp. enterica serovar Volkmarsdorf]|nr:ankyrin repeat domain-containing protein [Salmonella enterica subsp. enterica serovar Volkmarsdorf]
MIPIKSVFLMFFLLLITISFPYYSHGHERDFSLSSVASFPSMIDELKDRWSFCEKCLNNTQCNYNDVKQCKTVTLPDRSEALNLAVGRANTEAVYFLVNTAKADVNSTIGEYNETPLIVSAYYGTKEHQKIADFLISHGANINATASPPTETALITAIWKNNIEFAKLLLRNGADSSVTASGRKENYVCKYAIQKKQAEVVPYISNCCSISEQDPNWFREAGYLCP